MPLGNRFKMKLNVKEAENKFIPTVTAGDNNIFEFEVYDGKDPVELSETYRYTFTTKAVGKDSVMRDATVNEEGNVEVLFGYSETKHAGVVDGALQIYDENNKRISTMRMQVNVKGDMAVMGGLPAEDSTLVIADEALLTRAIAAADDVEAAKGDAESLSARFESVNTQLADITNTEKPKLGLVSLQRNLVSGFFSSTTGAFAGSNNGWYCCNIPVTDFKQFFLANPSKIVTFRIVYMAGDAFHSTVSSATGNLYTIPEGVTRILFNFATTTANPSTSAFTNFANLAEIEAILFYKYTTVYVEKPLIERINTLETGFTNDKVLKILSIGNSFSEDMQAFITDFAKSAGVNIVVGNTYLSGASFETHWDNAQINAAAYSYQKHTINTGMVSTPGKTLAHCITDEDWDIITFQQASPLSGVYSSFQPYLNNLMNYARAKATNPIMRFGLVMTWAYSSTYSTTAYTENYNGDQTTMYNAIVNAYKQAMRETKIDILIPCGTAIQNARTNSDLLAVGDELTRDGYHLNIGIGRVIVGLTLFEAILAPFFKKDLFLDASRTYSSADTYFLAYLSKMAARNAKLNPFKITEI